MATIPAVQEKQMREFAFTPLARSLRLAGAPVLLFALALAGAARAQGMEESTPAPSAVVQPWLFNERGGVPAAKQVVSSSRLSFSAAGGEGWPSGGTPLSAGAAFETITELGLGSSLSVQLSGLRGDEAVGASGARLGMRWAPLSSRTTRLLFSGGAVRQLTGLGGAWGTAALEHSIGVVRLATSVQAEKTFSSSRDPLDLRISAAADVGLGAGLRAGLEYSARDLEETGSPGAESGATQVAAAVFGARALDDKLSLSVGPGLALGGRTPRPVGRIAVLWSF